MKHCRREPSASSGAATQSGPNSHGPRRLTDGLIPKPLVPLCFAHRLLCTDLLLRLGHNPKCQRDARVTRDPIADPRVCLRSVHYRLVDAFLADDKRRVALRETRWRHSVGRSRQLCRRQIRAGWCTGCLRCDKLRCRGTFRGTPTPSALLRVLHTSTPLGRGRMEKGRPFL